MRVLVTLVAVVLIIGIVFVAGIQVGRYLQNPKKRDESPPPPTSAVSS